MVRTAVKSCLMILSLSNQRQRGQGIGVAIDAADALGRIAAARAPFVSRGDDSGTHKVELAIWTSAGIDAAALGPWYQSVGAGIDAALNTGVGLDAYVFSARIRRLNFGIQDGLALLGQRDPVLFNQYAYLRINPDRNAYVRNDLVSNLRTG